MLKMVATGFSEVFVTSYRRLEALAVFIDPALRNWNLTRCSVSETAKRPPDHRDKRRRLSRLLYISGGSRTMENSR
jgi:hypothetical protein